MPAPALDFTHTFRLGFLSVLLFVIEAITGLALMFYCNACTRCGLRIHSAPASQRAVGRGPARCASAGCRADGGDRSAAPAADVSYQIIHGRKRFHLADPRRPRCCSTLLLTFSGYLLPWDQLAYWAVTIGTSMADGVPWIGVHLLRSAARGSRDRQRWPAAFLPAARRAAAAAGEHPARDPLLSRHAPPQHLAALRASKRAICTSLRGGLPCAGWIYCRIS